MKRSHLLSLAAVGASLVLLGAGCQVFPTFQTDTEVKTGAEVAPADDQSGVEGSVEVKTAAPVKTGVKQALVCTDSDNGSLPLIKGTTMVKNSSNNNIVSTKVDYCASDSATFEYYCSNSGNSIESARVECGNNTSCVDGACVAAAARLAQVAGVCGADNGRLTIAPPHLELCSAGTPGQVMGSGPWTWTCVGLNGGATANCSAPKYLMSGICGSAHNTTVSAAPTTNLCSRGAPSPVTAQMTGQGPWTWTCAGEEAGAETASCKAFPAPLEVVDIVNGSCGSSHNMTLIGAPSTNLCSTGTPSAVTGEGPWAWNCVGAHGGTTASCAANVRIEP